MPLQVHGFIGHHARAHHGYEQLRTALAKKLTGDVALEGFDGLPVFHLLVDAPGKPGDQRESANGETLNASLHVAPLSRSKRATLPDIPRRA